jgi:hypothetical protein
MSKLSCIAKLSMQKLKFCKIGLGRIWTSFYEQKQKVFTQEDQPWFDNPLRRLHRRKKIDHASTRTNEML